MVVGFFFFPVSVHFEWWVNCHGKEQIENPGATSLWL